MALDSLRVYDTNSTNINFDAMKALRGFRWATINSEKLIVPQIQSTEGPAGALSIAANDAFNAGMMVIAPDGNGSDITAPASPGNAHMALAIGDYDAQNSAGFVPSRVSGTPDGHLKPDLLAPTDVHAAAYPTTTSGHAPFGGTSASAAFAAGAAALMHDWYKSAFGAQWTAPGSIYSALLAQTISTGSSNDGAGKLKLLGPSSWYTGAFTMGTTDVNIPFTVNAGNKDLKVALWWGEAQGSAHDDIDLYVYDAAHVLLGWSTYSGSVFEVFRKTGNLTPGTYTLQVHPYSMPRPTQFVYWTVAMSQ